MTANYIKNIAIVGAGGNVGSSTVRHLVATRRFNITVITRPDSTSDFPAEDSIIVRKGVYDDENFLASAFQGQDAAMFALSYQASDSQTKLINAAAKAGIKWIIPNEYSVDGLNQKMIDAVPILQSKAAARKEIEHLAHTHPGLAWIGIATNPWVVTSLQINLLGVNVYDKTATLFEGAGPFNLSTLEQVGLGITRLLSLPLVDPNNPRASLQHYANNFAYISSFSTTQRDLLAAAQRATGTTDQDWQISHDSIDARIKRARELLAQGGPQAFRAMVDLLGAHYIGEGLGGDYQAQAVEDAKVLGLPEEDLDVEMANAIELGPVKRGF